GINISEFFMNKKVNDRLGDQVSKKLEYIDIESVEKSDNIMTKSLFVFTQQELQDFLRNK
ncbi:MAG: hypothetical protein KAG14_04960, partial [Mycoplasmataceae bacterium]|nr:hypothetical protein [Mycoplasmataceae bacterium]